MTQGFNLLDYRDDPKKAICHVLLQSDCAVAKAMKVKGG